jgi:hypothetical protein
MKKRTILLAAALAAAPAAQAIEAYPLGAGERIVLDGKLDDAAWTRARSLDRFYEYSPRDKIEAMVRTEVRLAFDRDAIYVAVRAHDPDTSRLRAPFARRDNVLSDQDMVQVTIDPTGAKKFAHIFRVNANGSVGDGLFNEDTQNEDFSPDFEFDVVTGLFEGGWTAEFRIPFSSLRYGDPPSRQWSLVVVRAYPRDQRYRFATSQFPRDLTCFLCLNEPLTGIADLPPTRHLQLTPNGTIRSVERREPGSRQRENDVVPSMDIKWRPRADVVIDATINPDFSQVELDTPQLAANAQFALFFPEKRPFFLEGADILQSPSNAIYTRSVTDPAWGVRATQRGDGFDGTALVTRDDGGGLVLLPNTYTTHFAPQDFKSMASFVRARWQGTGVTLGALATDRTLEDHRGYNRVLGPDVIWFPTTENRVRAQMLGSWTTALPSADGTLRKADERRSHAAVLDWNYEGATWGQFLILEDIGREFRADNGFYGQNGYRNLYSETRRKFVNVWGFNDITPYVNAGRKTDPDGGIQYQQYNFGVRFGLPRNTNIVLEARPNNLIATRANGGVLKRDQAYFSIESTPFAWTPRLFTEVAYGDRLDVANNRIGKGAFIGFQSSLRPHPRAEIEYRIDNDYIDSRETSERIILQRIQQLLAIWHFSARDSVRTIVQTVAIRRTPALWDSAVPAREDTETISVVYGHRRGITAAFYVGASLTRNRIPELGTDSRQAEVFAKASWTFDVF